MAKIMANPDTHGWLIAAILREMSGWKVKQCLNAWRAISFSIDVCAREASKLHVRGKKLPLGFWLMWKKDG